MRKGSSFRESLPRRAEKYAGTPGNTAPRGTPAKPLRTMAVCHGSSAGCIGGYAGNFFRTGAPGGMDDRNGRRMASAGPAGRRTAAGNDSGGMEKPPGRFLLERHREHLIPSDGQAERMLFKAGEESPEAYEEACRKLHSRWAEALRAHLGIPDVHMSFFNGGD